MYMLLTFQSQKHGRELHQFNFFFIYKHDPVSSTPCIHTLYPVESESNSSELSARYRTGKRASRQTGYLLPQCELINDAQPRYSWLAADS